jgi:threonylcarbamoyladenosine tRNA methylthiotransferase MtaB
MRKTVALRTLGCRLNQAESDEILIALADRGMPVDEASPDVIVVNTCTVTSEASSASRKLIRRSVKEHPEATIVVTGCYAVAHEQDVWAMPGVDMVLPTKDRLAGVVATRAAVDGAVGFGFEGPRRNLRVQSGCNEMCTFCIVPTTRGGLESRPPREVLHHARRLVDSGARELILTGVHLGTYGYGSPTGLVDLLEELVEIEDLERIRLSSIEASHVDDPLIDLILSEPRLCRHLHLPLQTGSERIWQRMRRPGTLERFLGVVERARATIPHVAITTDVMVGFPGEDDDAFRQTLEVIERVGFEKLHVFRFSARERTPAATFSDQIPHETRRERSRVVRSLGEAIRGRWLQRHDGTRVSVLVEKAAGPVLTGHTDTYAPVRLEGPPRLVGRVVDVLVASSARGGLVGELPVLQDR